MSEKTKRIISTIIIIIILVFIILSNGCGTVNAYNQDNIVSIYSIYKDGPLEIELLKDNEKDQEYFIITKKYFAYDSVDMEIIKRDKGE